DLRFALPRRPGVGAARGRAGADALGRKPSAARQARTLPCLNPPTDYNGERHRPAPDRTPFRRGSTEARPKNRDSRHPLRGLVGGKERAMRSITVARLAAAAFAMAGASGSALADPGLRVSGPHLHANLALLLVHGASVPGPVPLTLQEAIAKGHVLVSETGRVNELEIENKGSEAVFIQAGDIVKGGRQDRVLTVSFLLPANSGRLPIASYCVEQGRWSARGTEDQKRFSSAGEAMPSRSALLAMAAPPAPKEPSQPEAALNPPAGTAALSQRVAREVDEVASKQRQVWDSVATTQRKLSQGLNTPVASPQSASSLQLALENDRLKGAQAAFMAALQPAGEKEADVVGYVVAINGRMNSANLYPSNAL